MSIEALDPTREKVVRFLRRDLFHNVVLLKALNLYAEHAQVHYCETARGSGALVLLPTHVSLFDSRGYPQTKYVLMLDVTEPEVVSALVRHIPRHTNLIFKLNDPAVRMFLERTFPMRRVTAFVSYTNTAFPSFTPDPAVLVTESVSERGFALFEAQGHPRPEIQEHFAGGEAFSFTCVEDGNAVATCFTFWNFENIHEIGGVYTVPQERRKGYARRVVTTALYELAWRGRIPRYVVQETNTPSAQLAHALGLTPQVTMEHWLYTTP